MRNSFISDPSLFINDPSLLINDPSLLINDPSLLQDYYLFLKTKLTCDKSLQSVENEIFCTFYKEYFDRQTGDYLLNTKIDLYKERIKPIHLNLNTTPSVLDIASYKTPTSLLEGYLLFIENNSTKDHDTLLNTLVYSILKSGIKNLKITVRFIKTYRRKIYIHCEHIKKRNESEVDYYINVLDVSLEFIERMEYKDLNITQQEYEELIGISK